MFYNKTERVGIMKKLALFSILMLVFGASAVFACGGSCDKDKDAEPQVMCGGDKDKEPAPAPDVMCGGGKDKEPAPAPDVMCGGGKDKEPAPAPEAMCGGSGCDKDKDKEA